MNLFRRLTFFPSQKDPRSYEFSFWIKDPYDYVARVNMKGGDVIQRDLENLETEANAKPMKFSQEKCKVLHLGHGNPRHH